jgi:hypothetical protein
LTHDKRKWPEDGTFTFIHVQTRETFRLDARFSVTRFSLQLPLKCHGISALNKYGVRWKRYALAMTTLGSAIISRGSEWRRWDLHFHSPLSGLNNQFPKLDSGEPDWESYLGALEALTDISVLGITDYFSVEGYSYVYEARKNGRLKNIALILPNIEFRLNKVIVTGSETKRLNYHVLFSEAVPPRSD